MNVKKMVRGGWLGALVVLACSSNSEVREVTPQDLLARAEDYIERGKHTKAIEELNQLSVDHPGVAFIDRVVYRLGEAYLGADFYPDAEFQFARVIRDYPFSEFADEAAFFGAETFYRQRGGIGNDASMARAAMSRFEMFLREYPDSPLAPEARARVQTVREFLALKKFRAAEQYFRHHRYESVRVYCDMVVEDYPEADIVPAAWLLHARASSKLDDRDRACEALSHIASHPSRPSAPEVIEEAAEIAGELGCAQALDPAATAES